MAGLPSRRALNVFGAVTALGLTGGALYLYHKDSGPGSGLPVSHWIKQVVHGDDSSDPNSASCQRRMGAQEFSGIAAAMARPSSSEAVAQASAKLGGFAERYPAFVAGGTNVALKLEWMGKMGTMTVRLMRGPGPAALEAISDVITFYRAHPQLRTASMDARVAQLERDVEQFVRQRGLLREFSAFAKAGHLPDTPEDRKCLADTITSLLQVSKPPLSRTSYLRWNRDRPADETQFALLLRLVRDYLEMFPRRPSIGDGTADDILAKLWPPEMEAYVAAQAESESSSAHTGTA